MSAQVLWVGLVGKYLECLWRQITALPWWNSSKIINIQYVAKFPLWELVPYQGFNSGPLCWQTGHSEVAKARSAFMQREPMLLVSHVISIAWPGPPVQSTLASVRCLQGKVHICYMRGPLSIDCWGPPLKWMPSDWPWCEVQYLHSLSILTPLPKASWSPIS